MDTEHPRSGTAIIGPRRIGQACDRCRKKKIKCDGASPSCCNCDKAGLHCEVSTTLLRNRKVRGFTSGQQKVEQLQAELERCQQHLNARDRNAVLEQELARHEQLLLPDHGTPTTSSVMPSASVSSRDHMNDPAYIIKHMGRLVHDKRGIGRFAGSTTGVHFVLTVEKECQKLLAMTGSFPASCFRLFLVQPYPDQCSLGGNSRFDGELRQHFGHPATYYCQQIETFIQNWDAFCPVLVRNQLIAETKSLLGVFHRGCSEVIDYPTIFTLLMIVGVNKYSGDATEKEATQHHEIVLAGQLLDKVILQRDMKSLQAVIIFALYHQLRGHCLTMTTLNGWMVSLAQSLGLHRHARRFKMSAGEIELRKRLWWWVYVFDRITSIVHGLPTLINDADVDNDMPMDCYLYDMETPELSHPLPGERTPVFFFMQYVSLGRKLSSILDLLCTTTRRRDGEKKIAELALELQMWNQNLKMSGISFDTGNITEPSSGVSHQGEGRIGIWLQLLSNLAMILIHRPGLSFDESTIQFEQCLCTCLNCSQAILKVLCDTNVPRWVRNISLVGPGTVFQSAVMYVYCQCKHLPSRPDGIPSLETSMTMIAKGISILDSDFQGCDSNSQRFYFESITEVIGTLQTLHSCLAQVANVASDATTIDHSDPFDNQVWGSKM